MNDLYDRQIAALGEAYDTLRIDTCTKCQAVGADGCNYHQTAKKILEVVEYHDIKQLHKKIEELEEALRLLSEKYEDIHSQLQLTTASRNKYRQAWRGMTDDANS